MALGVEVGLGPGHILLDEDPARLPKKGQSRPPFSAHFCCGQTAECIKMPLGMEVCVRWGPSSPLPKRGRSPQFSARIYCGQTAGWTKMAVGTEVGLDPRNIVLDGDPAPPKGGHTAAPHFSAHI